MEPVISVRGLNHFYGDGGSRKQVLYDVELEVKPGKILILTGPSGSGKTTLLTLIGGLRSVEDGEVHVLGHTMRESRSPSAYAVREQIGFIFQHSNLLQALRACENVQMSVGTAGNLPDDSRSQAVEMLEAVGLGHRVDYPVGLLSGGERQRVAVARALVRKPKIVLADEPTAALDRKSGRDVVELLQSLARRQNCAVLLVTHDNRILDIADEIVAMEDGRITPVAAGLAAHSGRVLQAFSRLSRSGELAPQVHTLSNRQFLEMLEGMTHEFEELLRVLDLGNDELLEGLLNQVLRAVTERIRDMLQAERATVFIVDRARGMLHSRIADTTGARPLVIEIALDKGIAGRVARSNRAENISNPATDADFITDIDRDTGFHARNLLCMPIDNRAGEVIAVAQMLNKTNGDHFSGADQRAFEDFAEPLGIMLESCFAIARRSRSSAE